MQLERVGPYLWRIPRDERLGMRVPGLVVADERLMEAIRSDASLEQLANGATLPGIVRASLAMPDIHQGYGLPVGGVVATDAERGVVSPGAIGFDINCGVRLLRTGLQASEITPRLRELVDALHATIPTGIGARATVALTPRDLAAVMTDGAAWAAAHGHGERDDLESIESGGRLAGADPDAVSAHARERGLRQLGSLGSGNHFLELQTVEEIYDGPVAARLGVRPGQLTVMIHTGSRGLGHQVCTDYLKVAGAALTRYDIRVPDRQLACAPVDSPEAAEYLRCSRQRIDNLPYEQMRQVRGRRIGAIFQDPLTSLNPLYTVGQQLVETIVTHLDVSAQEACRRAVRLLEETGIQAAVAG